MPALTTMAGPNATGARAEGEGAAKRFHAATMAVPGTDTAQCIMATSGTDLAYGAVQCLVLT